MKVVGIALVLAACYGPAKPAAPSAPNAELRVERAELANGLRLVVVTEPTSSALVTVRYGVGSVDDPAGHEGLAHLTEHLLFDPVMEELEATTLELNGITGLDSTVFIERTMQLAAVLNIEAKRSTTACEAVIPVAFARQRDVVANELRERSVADAVQASLAAGVFGPQHPFARLATPATIATITQADVCAFFTQHYAPNNAVVVISGNTTLAAARPLVEAAFGAIPRRAVAATPVIPPSVPHRTQQRAPVTRPWVVFAWPLPADPAKRERMRAAAHMAGTLVHARVNGLAEIVEIGSSSQRMLLFTIAPSDAITPDDAIRSSDFQLTHTNDWFGSGLFEQAANRAIYRYVASLDHSFDRDAELADQIATGRYIDALAPVEALRSLGRSDAHAVVQTALSPEVATVLTLLPGAAPQPAATLQSQFREDVARHPEDAALAHRAAVVEPAANPFEAVRRRTLPNGLEVVLAPLGTTPVVDIRLVFPTGAADEAKHGLAILAALGMDAEFTAEMLRFYQAGGAVEPDVGFDHVAFEVTGLASHLDALLLGLVGGVREGGYEGVNETVRELTAATAHGDRGGRMAEDVWRVAIYGAHHPYVYAGQWFHAVHLSWNDLASYRNAHYVPIGATLIITGNFDAANANRWIDYYFADWRGSPQPRTSGPAVLTPLAFSQVTTEAQVTLRIGFPAPRDHATALILAEMLDEASGDVRARLAASYGVHAQLVEHRLGSTIELEGRIDATRAAEACALLRARIAELASDEQLFVAARRHAIAAVRSIDYKASSLADRLLEEVVLGRSHLAHPELVTIEQLAPLDLARAAVLVRGPQAAIEASLAALGRTATPPK